MKTRYLKTDWLLPLVGIVVVAGSLLAARTYFDMEQQAGAEQALGTTLDRLQHDLKLCGVLKAIHNGEVAGGAQRLDLLLCDDILELHAGLTAADLRTRTYVQDAFRRIALLRPKIGAGTAASAAPERSHDQAAAERILASALGAGHIAQTK